MPRLGLTLAPAGGVAGAGGEGVVITNVEPDSIAAEHGFRTGDVIMEVAGKPVDDAGGSPRHHRRRAEAADGAQFWCG